MLVCMPCKPPLSACPLFGVWHGVRPGGPPQGRARALTPGQRRRGRRRLDLVRHDSATDRPSGQAGSRDKMRRDDTSRLRCA
jgi:hypothetical protein